VCNPFKYIVYSTYINSMGVSDIIFDSAVTMIEELIEYYYDDNPYQLVDDDLVLSVVASHIKAYNSMGYIKLTKKNLKTINAINWNEEAKKLICEVIEDKLGGK